MVRIGCGGIILKENKVLLVLRQNSKTFDNVWSNPGGEVEPTDTSIEDAVVRECDEELGIKVRITRKLSDYFDYHGETLEGIYSGYEVEIIEGEPYRREPYKIAEIKYFSLEVLPQNIAPYTLQYINDVKIK